MILTTLRAWPQEKEQGVDNTKPWEHENNVRQRMQTNAKNFNSNLTTLTTSCERNNKESIQHKLWEHKTLWNKRDGRERRSYENMRIVKWGRQDGEEMKGVKWKANDIKWRMGSFLYNDDKIIIF